MRPSTRSPQRLDHVAAFDDRRHRQTVRRAAIGLGDHQVLRDVDQTARQVTRVRGLQRRIGQTLAGAVRRDEVLQHVQAFAEVRRDRRLDDRAVRLAPSGRACRRAGGSAPREPRAPESAIMKIELNDFCSTVSPLRSRRPPRCRASPSSPWRPGRWCATRCRRPCCSARRW